MAFHTRIAARPYPENNFFNNMAADNITKGSGTYKYYCPIQTPDAEIDPYKN